MTDIPASCMLYVVCALFSSVPQQGGEAGLKLQNSLPSTLPPQGSRGKSSSIGRGGRYLHIVSLFSTTRSCVFGLILGTTVRFLHGS